MKFVGSLAVSVGLSVALALEAGRSEPRAVGQVPALFPNVRSVLWVGAHPDDEVFAAPLLARLCLEEGRRCSMLILTRGEAGVCRLPGGCVPDLASVRASEAARSAALFRARLVLWRLPDGGGSPRGEGLGWDAAQGSHAALVERMSRFLAVQSPDLVLTLDPRHGSTCHDDHRAAGRLVREGVAALPIGPRRPALFLIENQLELASSEGPNGAPRAIRFRPAASALRGAMAFDASGLLAATGRPAWRAFEDVMRRHSSQFDAPFLTAIRALPPSDRAVWLGPADALLLSDDGVASCE